VCFVAQPAGLRAEDLLGQFKTEAPKHWAAWEEYMAKASWRVEVMCHIVPGGPWPNEPGGDGYHAKFRIKRNYNWLVEEVEDLTPNRSSHPFGRVSGMNSRYGFTLWKRTKDDKWAVTDLKSAGPVHESNEFEVHCLPHLRLPSLGKFERYFTRPDIEFLSVKRETVNGRDAVRVDTRTVDTIPDVREQFTSDNSYWFDPDNHWALCKYEGHSYGRTPRWTGHRLFNIEFGEPRDGFRLPALMWHRQRQDVRPPGEWDELRVVFSDFKREELPEYEFSVGAYGLPEIDPALARPRWWLWSLVVAAVALAGAVLLRRRARQAAAA
jgi:hypothetical protein